MSMNTNNASINKSNTAEWQYSNDGSWEYDTDSLARKVEDIFDTSIDKDKFQAAVKGKKVSDSTLYSVFDANHDGKLSHSELSAVTTAKPITTATPTTTAVPTTIATPNLEINYGSDGQYTYNLEKFTQNLEKQAGMKIDREKMRTTLGIEFTDQKTITDKDVYKSLDANKDGKLTQSELSILKAAEPETKPETKAEIKYGSDKQYAYNLDAFSKNIEKQTGTEIDQEKLRALLGIKFGDQKNITDKDIYDNFDTNGDLVLDNTEILNIVDKTKKTNEPTTPVDVDAMKALIEKTIKEMMPEIIKQMMQQIMQQMMPQIMQNVMQNSKMR